MRTPRPSCVVSLSLAVLALGGVPATTSAQVPGDMAYQGVLRDAVGAPLAGPVDLVLRIYELPAGGTPLYTETHTGVEIDAEDGVTILVADRPAESVRVGLREALPHRGQYLVLQG